MKELFFGLVLILVLGIGGFLYRYTMEHPPVAAGPSTCTTEAKVCPDGTAVGRTGSACSFVACPLPNREFPEAGVGFVIPAGYVENVEAATPGDDLLAAFEKPPTGNPPHVIVLRRYPIPAGKTATDVMLAETSYDTSGEPVRSMEEFKTVTVGGRTFHMITVDRFEAQVHTVYYLTRATDLLRFEILERNVTAWTEPTLVIDTLPEHQTLQRMLATLQVAP